MDWSFFKELLEIDSTSGKERKVAEWLAARLPEMFPAGNRPVLRVDEVGDGTLNLLLTWGTPRIVFCSHMDTVPPYIPPTFEGGAAPLLSPCGSRPISPSDTVSAGPSDDGRDFFDSPSGEASIRDHAADGRSSAPTPSVIPGPTGNLTGLIAGRGSCDAKGQVFAIVETCKRLAAQGLTDFGALLLAGEETGSWGAKAFAKTDFRAPYLVVCEPTDNCMVSASKGTKSFDLRFIGEAFHSGYPEHGVSAVDLFVDFVNRLREKDFGMDPILGATTWNIGLLRSDNPQNILSPELTCRLYFRTTFVSDQAVCKWMASLEPESVPASGRIRVTPRGGDTPARYWTVEGLPSKSVSFGSDAPHLTNFTHKAICGPGSINVAHRDDEHVLVADLEQAVEQYLTLYRTVQGTK